MKSLIFVDVNSTISVEYVTDLISPNAENFTVMETKGVDNAWEQSNLPFQKLPNNLGAFKSFAEEHDLKLTLVDSQKTADDIITLVNFTGQYYGGGLGIDNL